MEVYHRNYSILIYGYLKGKVTQWSFDRHANLKYNLEIANFGFRFYVDGWAKSESDLKNILRNQLQGDSRSAQSFEVYDLFTGEE